MILTYKILSDKSSAFGEQWFEKMATRRPTRQSRGLNNLIEGRASHNYRREFFSLRVPRAWNRLPDHVKEAGSATAFKARYRHNLEVRVA
jgi:transposase-like protein